MLSRITQARIGLRLPLLIVIALVTSVGGMSFVYYEEFEKSTDHLVETKVTTEAFRAERNVQSFLDGIASKVDELATGVVSRDALKRFAFALNIQGPSVYEELRAEYIENNPFPIGERQNYDKGSAGTAYDQIHSEIQGYFRDILDRYGFYDLFLIDRTGAVIYSVFKEDDYGTNLIDGPYSGSGLGDTFKKVLTLEPGHGAFIDFAPYAPSANQPASFIGQAVFSEGGDFVGAIVIQVPLGRIKSALENEGNFNQDDEIYIVGADGRARTASRHSGVLDVFEPVPDLIHLDATNIDQSEYFQKVIGINGNTVNVGIRKFNVFGEEWTAVAELDSASLYEALDRFERDAWLFTGVGLLISLIVGATVARSITRPIQTLASEMERIARQEYDSDLPDANRMDEFGDLTRVISSFREKLIIARDADLLQEKARAEQMEVVSSLGRGLGDLATGDLTTQIEQPFPSEYDVLRCDFNSTVVTMNDLMQSIVLNSHEIRARAEEISASSDDLSHRTESQAATLEETAAALDELTASVRAAAEGASEVERVVSDARGDAKQSEKVVLEAVDAMTLIKKSSNEISQIIGVIDDIAFQTNLLSLNAGVEAARAGDAGRGFAVVASEVRALAQRSSEAAKQIKSLINSSSEQVDSGVGLVGKAGDALNSIIDRVSNIDELVVDIATGAREQSIGLGEINVGMNQLDHVTQQNAAMVEEATAAATTLNNEAMNLNQVITRFKLGKSEVGEIKDEIEEIQTEEILSETEIEWTPTKIPAQDPLDMAANSERWQDF